METTQMIVNVRQPMETTQMMWDGWLGLGMPITNRSAEHTTRPPTTYEIRRTSSVEIRNIENRVCVRLSVSSHSSAYMYMHMHM